MRSRRLAIAGLGNVGRRFLELLQLRAIELRERYQTELTVVAALDSSGAVVDPAGLPLAELIAVKARGGHLDQLTRLERLPGDLAAVLERSAAGVYLDATPTDRSQPEPGVERVAVALRAGRHAVLATKGPLVHAFDRLAALSEGEEGPALKFGGAVCGAMPTINVGLRDLAGGHISQVEGVFNLTSQIVLGMLAQGRTLEEAIAEAQRQGVAEADPSLDLEGYDSANKLVIVANAVLGMRSRLEQVERAGVSAVTPELLREARAAGQRVALVATAEVATGKLRVGPRVLAPDHPLGRLGSDEMGVTYVSDLHGWITVISSHQGPMGTAAAMLRDVLELP